jgi:hypothetical protein
LVLKIEPKRRRRCALPARSILKPGRGIFAAHVQADRFEAVMAGKQSKRNTKLTHRVHFSL